ncbi:sister chromatid cohesion 1 protein 1 isoform X3 [Typha latifolia]|uniref:sister chromatid cohesion 1 protein 1 isoform X3 n=1 Tax=Typha latifolia TaxID=4733 RepID=UPI003C2B0DF7
MFYSHQLLARKAPLGQIWMAATMHAKMNRRKLDKLDIIKICEEILNPSVPMALRLTGILMGGVVIVYERKVKLLYGSLYSLSLSLCRNDQRLSNNFTFLLPYPADDVTRFLVEINEAWRVKPASDPTVLPKGKSQAKYEAVTLPENVDMEVEQPMRFSDASHASARFQRMRLDDLDELYVNINIGDDDIFQNHQAEAANITLFDDFGSGLAETDLYNRFERFDIGDEETQINFTPQDQPQVPSTLVPSPPGQDEPPRAQNTSIPAPSPPMHPPQGGAFGEIWPREQEQQETKRQKPQKRKACRNGYKVVMDNDQIMIPGSIYQTWLQDSSNLVSKRRRAIKPSNPFLSWKISNLMDLPLVALISSSEQLPFALYYPAPLIELWKKYTRLNPANNSPSGEKSAQAQDQQNKSPPERLYTQDLPGFPPEAFQSEVGSHPLDMSIEKLRANLENMDSQGSDATLHSDHFVTPGSPGRNSRSIPSSGSGGTFMPLEPEIQLPSGRSKRRQHSSSRTALGSLDPVDEDFPLQQNVRDFKMRRLSEVGATPELELLEETGPTPTPCPVSSVHSIGKITQSIRTHLKLHFETPGAPQSESLNQLAFGMNPTKAAQLFYQTCVLSTYDFIKVQQVEPYGDILISRGPKM